MEEKTAIDLFVEELTRQGMFMNLFAKEIQQAKKVEEKQKKASFFEGYKKAMKIGGRKRRN